jgi:hypothetical protein
MEGNFLPSKEDLQEGDRDGYVIQTRWRGKPEEKSFASKSGRYTTQEPTHKDSVWGPCERKIGPRTDLKVGHFKDVTGVRFGRERAPGI